MTQSPLHLQVVASVAVNWRVPINVRLLVFLTLPFILIGPILWGHSGPLCHALSLSLLSLSWTSMRRRRATVAACDSSDTW